MFHFDYTIWFSGFSYEIRTFLIAMIPISELRVSIPIAIKVYHMTPQAAFFWSVAGNLIPMILILFILNPVAKFLSSQVRLFKVFFDWLFEHTRKRGIKKFETFGSFAVFILTATPIPLIGGWTGPLAAFVFDVPIKISLPLVILGCATSGIFVTLFTLGLL